jgi:2-polyprenyl-6-methoxyphenol hydroxylase-like FAD-dependent oxidoreductase
MTPEFDIAVVGAGLAGSLSAALLGRAGYRVALIDYRADIPADFRVEKIGGDQFETMERLGLLDGVAARSVEFNEIINIRHGREIDRSRARHLGILYPDLVLAARGEVPASVVRITGRVVDIRTSDTTQDIELQNGTSLSARLIVLATGMGDLLRKKLGITRQTIVERQSLSFGFMLRPRIGEFGFAALTSYGDRPADAIDYLSLFPTLSGMRANLFTFLDPGDPRVGQYRADMHTMLLRTLPGLRRYLEDFEVPDKVQSWLMDLTVADNVRQPGVVLIGDAYQTSCPAAGRGVSRLLSDVELLATDHAPRWLSTPGMDADKIAAFYDDPRKADMDARALALSNYRRDLAVGAGMKWALHRRQHYLRRRVVGWLDGVSPQLTARLRARHGAAVSSRPAAPGRASLH